MVVLIEQVLIFLIFAAAGYILTKAKYITSEKTGILSRIILFIFLPCTIISSLTTRFNIETLKSQYVILLYSCIILISIIILTFVSFKFVKMRQFTKNIFMYALIIPNYGNMGYPLVKSIFGAQMEYYIILFCLPFSLFTYTIGYCMLTDNEGDKFHIEWKRFINPVFISTAIGCVLGLLRVNLPDFLMDLFSKGSACIGPVSMILVGSVAAEFKFTELLKDWKSYIIVALRTLVIPISVCLILKGIKSAELALIPAVATLAMPCGSNTIVFSKLKGESSEPAASIVLISTVICLITIPLCLKIAGASM